MAPEVNGNPLSVAEIARRIQRVETLLDERIVTRDMLNASEKLYEAREIAHAASTQALEARVSKLEGTNSKIVFAVLTAFLMLLVSIISQVIAATGGGTP